MAKTFRTIGTLVLLIMMLATLALPLQAASLVQPISRSERVCGTSRCVSLSGRVSLSTGESVSAVRIYVNGINSVPLSQAAGTYNATTNAWTASVGDYQLVSYYVTITIKKNGTVIGALRTPTYYWGVP